MTHYLDVTNTFLTWHGTPTGIQRVIQGLSKAAEKAEFKLAVFDPSSRRWFCIPHDVVFGTFEADIFVRSNRRLKAFFGSSAPSVSNNSLAGPASAGPAARNQLKDSLKTAIRPLYRQGHRVGMWMARQGREKLLNSKGTPITFAPGDRLHVVDANWALEGYFEALRAEKKKQPAFDIIGFIYDLTPITHPQFVSNSDFVLQFTRWIEQLLSVSSCILTDSRDAANETIRVFNGSAGADSGFTLRLRNGAVLHHSAPPRAVRFGSRIEPAPETLKNCSDPKQLISRLESGGKQITEDQKQLLLEGNGWALWVGLIHPRKNLDVQINALEPLWQSGKFSLPLFWVGRNGDGSDDLLHRVRTSPCLKRYVIRLESVSDELLWYLFQGARFSLYTSWTEGFGLPVSESLQQGCPVIASSGGSIPEVAGDLVEYFEPWDARGLQDKVLKLMRPEEYEKAKERTARFKPFSWEDTLIDFKKGTDSCLSVSERAEFADSSRI